jgi:2'-5' RNA ligase
VRTALIVALAEAAPVVDRWRERSTGMPPHVTLLFPFVAPVTDALVAELQALFAPVAPFAVELRELRRFPGVLYLEPEPAAPFANFTDELVRRHPDQPPYGGAFPAVPHLTVVQGDDGLLDRAEQDVRPALPIVAEAREALLLEEGSPWRVRARFPFSA